MYIIDNVIDKKDLENLYIRLIQSSAWTLDRTSNPRKQTSHHFPGLVVRTEQGVLNSYWDGYFVSVYERLNQLFQQKNKFSLPRNIFRIHLGAKTLNSETDFHLDEHFFGYSIVGFLTPKWNKKWGGELYVEDKKIDYVPGRFVVFKTDCRHNGEAPKETIPYWRISINYVGREE